MLYSYRTHTVLTPFIFVLISDSMTVPRASFGEYYIVALGLYYTSFGWGYLVSVFVSPSLAQLVGVTVVFGNSMFSGGSPTLKQMESKIVPLCWLPHVSFIRYGLEAMYIMEIKNWEEVGWGIQSLSLETFLNDVYNYSLHTTPRNLAVLYGFGVALRVVAAVAMHIMDKNKKL
jgi:hypothetical protein